MTDQRLALDFAASSDRGLVRTNNEDSAYAGPRLLALADGMGGHAAGEVASRFLVDTLRTLDSPLLDEPDERRRLTAVLERAVDEGNERIASHVDENPQLEGMGCTLTAILFSNAKAAMCHVGDSAPTGCATGSSRRSRRTILSSRPSWTRASSTPRTPAPTPSAP